MTIEQHVRSLPRRREPHCTRRSRMGPRYACSLVQGHEGNCSMAPYGGPWAEEQPETD